MIRTARTAAVLFLLVGIVSKFSEVTSFMPNVFTAAQAKLAIYYYERLPYTVLLDTLPTGPTSVLDISDLGATTPNHMAILNNIAVTNASQVQLTISAMSESTVLAAAAASPNLQSMLTKEYEGYRTTKRLSVSIGNSSGATISNFQLNYMAATKRLTTADRLLRGLPLSAKDAAYIKKFDLYDQGYREMSIPMLLERVFYSQIIDQPTYSFELASTTAQQSVLNVAPKRDEILVLTRLATEASLGTQTTLSINRDGDSNYVSVFADNATISQPLDVWVPCVNHMTLYLTATTPSASVPISASFLRIKQTELIKALFGLRTAQELPARDRVLYEEMEAGVMA
jgi:hypothetical protein